MVDQDFEPDRVQNRTELARALRAVLPNRSVRELERALEQQHKADLQANRDRRRTPQPPGATAGHTTIHEALTGKRLPSPELLLALLRLSSSLTATNPHPWLAARARAVRDPGFPHLAGRQRVRDTSPRLLGVHPAIEVAGTTGDLPFYVARDTDTERTGVRARITAAAGCGGGFVLLVGGSSVGKTRCAYEAIRELLPDWWLIHPSASGTELRELAGKLPAAPTVIWLDELQRYLTGSDRLTADIVRTLLRRPAPTVLVGTLWPDRYAAYITPPKVGASEDPHRGERELLMLADVVRVNSRWSSAERDRARQASRHDPRIAQALQSPDGFDIPQTLAAAPQLVSRWEDADPYAAAVLAAAVDATRLGLRSPLPAGLLRAAAPGYCDTRAQARAPTNWFETAMAYATETLHGAAAALEPTAGIGMGEILGYMVADYLLQHAGPQRRREPVPQQTWDALVTHIHQSDDMTRLGISARNRMLYRYAASFFKRAAEAGDVDAVEQLASLHRDRGDLAEAERLLAPIKAVQAKTMSMFVDEFEPFLQDVERENEESRRELVSLLVRLGDPVGAEEVAQEEPKSVWITALRRLSGLLIERGNIEGALAWLQGAADKGDQAAASVLARLLGKRNDADGLRNRAAAGDIFSSRELVDLLIKRGDVAGAITYLQAEADTGGSFVAERLANLLAGEGDVEGLLARVNAGDPYATKRLVDLLIERGDIASATAALRPRADAGDPTAASVLAALLADQNDIDGLRTEMHADNPYAARNLIDVMNRQNTLLADELIRFGLNPDGTVASRPAGR